MELELPRNQRPGMELIRLMNKHIMWRMRLSLFACFTILAVSIAPSMAQSLEPHDSDGQEVKWLRSATEAARLAGESGKPILVYVRSEHCHYCDLLQKKTWQDPATRSMIMREMIPLKLTLEENREAVEAMKVKGYPSTIVFSASREYLARIDGFVTPEDFQKHLLKARMASRSQAQNR